MAGDRPPPVSLQRSYSAAGRRSRDRRSPRRRVLAGDMHKDAPPGTAGRDAGPRLPAGMPAVPERHGTVGPLIVRWGPVNPQLTSTQR